MEEYFKGRDSQLKTDNQFLKAHYVAEHPKELDEPLLAAPDTQFF